MKKNNLKKEIVAICAKAQEAAGILASLSQETKNNCLKLMAEEILSNKEKILKANKKDVALSLKSGLNSALIERLTLDDKKIKSMSGSFLELINLKDPIGEVIKSFRRPNGLEINKVRVPIGVIAIIYESRPNVTADCIGLCFKSGNACILRGGSESINSNIAIFEILRNCLNNFSVPEAAINLITTTDRLAVDILLKLDQYIDLVIPRGGENLIKKVVKLSRIPVIKHYKGICHVYVDEWADLNMAENICFNAKVQRPGVCNAMESMLVHKDVAIRFLPGMLKKFKEAGVEIRGCALTQKIAKKGIKKASEKDYRTEYLDLILSVKVIDDLKEAINHINTYGSHHSDAIITDNREIGEEFLNKVDSACVYINASTRFTDGFQFGFGAEIGISTDKIHARGPMALEELTSYKYKILGDGQIRL